MRYSGKGQSNLEVEFEFVDQNFLPGFPTATLLDANEDVIGVYPAVLSINNLNAWVSTIVTVPDVKVRFAPPTAEKMSDEKPTEFVTCGSMLIVAPLIVVVPPVIV